MRNSSLVEGSRADNVPGLKPVAEAEDTSGQWSVVSGQKEGNFVLITGHRPLTTRVVGERRYGSEASAEAGAEL